MLYSLLIVDDTYETRHGLSDYFPWQETGFQVVSQAENGQDALKYLLENDTDAVLCDIEMPGMNGIELVQQIRERNLNTKVVFISGYRNFDYAREAMILGVVKYILKPTTYDELMETFNSLKNFLDTEKSGDSLHPALHLDDGKISKLIEAVISHLQKDYRTASLESAADIVHLHPGYVSRMFRKITGKAFSHVLSEIKMEKAAELLREGDLKIYEISKLIGYSSEKYFSRIFKQHFDITPKDYRYNHSIEKSQHTGNTL
ncbi:MAG: response regulator [Bacteroidetes bacterium]|nr:response regulator [Bacteroidota bacterium]